MRYKSKSRIKKTGVSFQSFPENRKCWVHKSDEHILAAKELADWLEKGIVHFVSKPQNITGDNWRDRVLNKTGIICFEDYYAPSGGSGGEHIDLWDGSSLTGFGSWLRTRFNIVVPGFWSDFRQSKTIRFFEVK
ncbi:MAG: type VI secretion system amidase effector protein Tae4 [Gammaproteobacteria bacterium]|nr:type VI secretion system amidase effector protein Tae4 [Gammaproteobacteria bacterium]